MRSVFYRSAALAFLLQLSLGTVQAGTRPDGCAMQFAFLEMRLRFNMFVVSRNLHEYGTYLPKEFREVLKELKPESHWIDAGAGKGVALQQYLQSMPEPANATGVVYTGKAPKDAHSKLRYLSGRKIEDIPANELGRADLITDIFGPASYSERVDEVINKYIEVLKPGGRAYISFGLSAPSVLLKGARYPDSIAGFLTGLDLPPFISFERDGTSLIIRRHGEGTYRMPELELRKFESGAPPYMQYGVKSP